MRSRIVVLTIALVLLGINLKAVVAQTFSFNIPLGTPVLTGVTSVAVDSSGNIYGVHEDLNQVVKFSPTGEEIFRIGGSGTGDGQFNSPRNLVVDGTGNVYVADKSNHRIQKFDSSGNFLLKFGTFGTGDGQFNSPRGILRLTAPGTSTLPTRITVVYRSSIQVGISSSSSAHQEVATGSSVLLVTWRLTAPGIYTLPITVIIA
jgi:hypothetical protein